MMRQNEFIFDIEGGRIGTARSTCSADPDMIPNEKMYFNFGNTFGLEPNPTDQAQLEFAHCNHTERMVSDSLRPEL